MKAKKTQFVLLILVVAMGAGLIMFRNGGLNSNTKINVALDEIKSVDLVDHYPTTQKEVVELFCKITKEFYNKDNDEKAVAVLANKMRQLFSEELLANNPYNEYMERLLAEIAAYKKANRVILFYKIDRMYKNDIATIDGVEKSTMRLKYDIVDSADADIEIYQKIVLVKENGLWKILGWSAAEPFDE